MVYDARYQGTVRIEYPIHPLFGLQGAVRRRVKLQRCDFKPFFCKHHDLDGEELRIGTLIFADEKISVD